MRTKVQKWGNSLAVRIPKTFAEDSQIKPGAVVNLTLEDGKPIIDVVSPLEYKLDELLSEIDETNIHEEISTGKPVGKEVW